MANTDPIKFGLDIVNFSKAVDVTLDQVVRKLAFDFLDGVLRRSPVDTGRFRGSWRVAVATPDLSVEGEDFTGSAGTVTPEQQATINTATIHDQVRVTNNLPYAEPLEDGHSGQAPSGVFRVTFDDMITQVNAVIAEVRVQNGV